MVFKKTTIPPRNTEKHKLQRNAMDLQPVLGRIPAGKMKTCVVRLSTSHLLGGFLDAHIAWLVP